MDRLVLWLIILFQFFVILCLCYGINRLTKQPLPTEQEIDDMVMRQFTNKYMRNQRNAEKVSIALEIAGECSGFVYIIKETGLGRFYKIGRTTAIVSRLSTLETAMPYPMEIVDIYPCRRFAELETALHRRYADKRHRNEWFELDDSDLQTIRLLCYAWRD